MTLDEQEKIRKLKEEVEAEFFSDKPKKISVSKQDSEEVAFAKKELEIIKYSNFDSTSIIKDIFLHPNVNRRFEQLRNINNARMSYNNELHSKAFELLDSNIDDIEEMIFRCEKISTIAFKYGVKGIVFASWCRGTIHIDRIRLAYELSAEYRMDLATQTLEDGINNPNLQIQYSGLIRELALQHSRMAGFQNQAKFGKKPDLIATQRPVQIMTDSQMTIMIEEFRKHKLDQRQLSATDYVEFTPVLDNKEADKVENESIDDIIANAKARKADESET